MTVLLHLYFDSQGYPHTFLSAKIASCVSHSCFIASEHLLFVINIDLVLLALFQFQLLHFFFMKRARHRHPYIRNTQTAPESLIRAKPVSQNARHR